MRIVPTTLAAAGLALAAALPAAAQENCQARIDALSTALAERYPELAKVAGETTPEPPKGSDQGALPGNPNLSTETSIAANVPTSVMAGAGPEVSLAEEEKGPAGAEAPASSKDAGAAASARPLSQQQVDRVVTLRTLATERLSAGKEAECRAAVEEARGILGG